MRPEIAEESERRYEMAIVGIGSGRLLSDLEAERASPDAAFIVLQFDPELMPAGWHLGLRDFNALRGDEWRQALGQVNGRLLKVGDDDSAGVDRRTAEGAELQLQIQWRT